MVSRFLKKFLTENISIFAPKINIVICLIFSVKIQIFFFCNLLRNLEMRISWYLMNVCVHFTGIITWKPPQLKDRKKVKDCVQYKEIMETFFWEIPPLHRSLQAKGYYHKCMNKSKSRGFFKMIMMQTISTCNLRKISYFESTTFFQMLENE